MTDAFQSKVQRLDRSVRARVSSNNASASGDNAPSTATTNTNNSSTSLPSSSSHTSVAMATAAAIGNAALLLDDAILSEQCSAAELTFFREASLDFNFPLSDLADSVTAVISTVVKLRSGIPDEHELKLMRSHLNTITIEMQLLTKHLESIEDCVTQLADDDHWVKRESANICDATKTLEEKVGLFRLYLKDVAGPSGASHRHKLLFASQYLVETAVQLLRAVDVAALETIIQMAVRAALVAQRIVGIAFRSKLSTSGGADSSNNEKHTPLKSLMPLLTDCLVTLTNAVWKRGLQLPDAVLRQQLDETCTNIGASARIFIDVCSERRKMVMRNSKRTALREHVTVNAANAAAAAAEVESARKRSLGDSDSDAPVAASGKKDLAKKANEALDVLQAQLAHMCALLAASHDSPATGASLAAEVDRARKQLFRIIDTHLHFESSVRPDGGRSGPSKAELSGNAVLRLAMLLKRLVVDFESLKLVPGSLTAAAVAVSGMERHDEERPVTRVASVQSLSKLIRELTQTASSLVEHMPPSPALQQVHVFIVVARRYLLRLQLACMAQIAGSPIQVHVPLPLLLRGMTATLSLLVRGLDEIGVMRAEREAWKNQRAKAARHRRRLQRFARSTDLPPSIDQAAVAAQSYQQQQQQQQPQQQPQQSLQPSSSSTSLSSSTTTTVRRVDSSGDDKSSRASSLRETRESRTTSTRNRESLTIQRPNSKPNSLRNRRSSTELSPEMVQHAASSPARMSTSKRKSLPPTMLHHLRPPAPED